MNVGSPIHDAVNKCHELKIENATPIEGELVYPYYVDFTRFSKELNVFIQDFLEQASSYFSKPLDPTLFFQRLVHSYSTDDLSGVSIKSISWIPARVVFYPSRYEIKWTVFDLELNPDPISGTVEADILLSDKPLKKPITESEQKRIRQKIRQARLKSALARLHVEQLTEKYYAKYGTFDGFSDEDSELSSDFEFNPNEVPRKI